MIRSTLMAWAVLAALVLGLAGCESTGSERVYTRHDYYDDPYWRDTYYRDRCCYNEKGVVRPPRHQAGQQPQGRQPPGPRSLPQAPRPPPPPPPPPP